MPEAAVSQSPARIEQQGKPTVDQKPELPPSNKSKDSAPKRLASKIKSFFGKKGEPVSNPDELLDEVANFAGEGPGVEDQTQQLLDSQESATEQVKAAGEVAVETALAEFTGEQREKIDPALLGEIRDTAKQATEMAQTAFVLPDGFTVASLGKGSGVMEQATTAKILLGEKGMGKEYFEIDSMMQELTGSVLTDFQSEGWKFARIVGGITKDQREFLGKAIEEYKDLHIEWKPVGGEDKPQKTSVKSLDELDRFLAGEAPAAPIYDIKQIIRGHIAQWQKSIDEQREFVSTNPNNMPRNLIEDIERPVLRDMEEGLKTYEQELEHPTWSTGIRSEDPEDYAYHGTQKVFVESIAKSGLLPSPLAKDPGRYNLWYAGFGQAYDSGDSGGTAFGDSALLRFPAGAVGKNKVPLNGGPGAVNHGIPPDLIDVSVDGGKTWHVIAPPENKA